VLIVTGDLTRLAWHIGNRHTPCQIEADHLVIRADHVLAAMLTGLGASVTPAKAPFTPEGGAYGHGRTMGHEH
jgi:urease accessory protein